MSGNGGNKEKGRKRQKKAEKGENIRKYT